MTRTIVGAGCAVLLLLVGGCTQHGGGTAATDGSSAAAAGESSPSPGTVAAAVSVGPLGTYLAKVGWGRSDDAAAERQAKDQKVADLISACMRDLGFTYAPITSAEVLTAERHAQGASRQPIEQNGLTPGTIEYAETYGFSMTFTPEQQAAFDQAQALTTPDAVDPNTAYVDAMSPAEHRAFIVGLSGEPAAAAMFDGAEYPAEYDWTTSGCTGSAQHEVFDVGDAARNDPAFASLLAEITAFQSTGYDDPLTDAVWASWSSCMATSGFDVKTYKDAVATIGAMLDAVAVKDPATGEITPGDWSVRAPIHDVEIRMAVADITCQKSTDFDAHMTTASHAIEQTFVDAHKAELDAWVEAYAQGTR